MLKMEFAQCFEIINANLKKSVLDQVVHQAPGMYMTGMAQQAFDNYARNQRLKTADKFLPHSFIS